MRIIVALLIIITVVELKAQSFDLIGSFTNSKYDIYDTYGVGIGFIYNLKSKSDISFRYIFENNENYYVHSELSLIVSPSRPLDDQTEFSSEKSMIRNHLIGFAFMYNVVCHDNAKLSFGPDLTYNYFVGHDSYYYYDKYRRSKIGVGAQLRIDINNLFIPRLGLFTCIIPNYSIGLNKKIFDWGLEEPYVSNLKFIDFQIGLTYNIKKKNKS